MKKFFRLTLCLILSLTFFSCEIGLGSAVDTEAPSLEITAPVSDAIIRDAFRLAGTWSDDGTISDLTITLERTDGTKSYGPYAGTYIESEDEGLPNTWFCEIYPKDENFDIVDGTYEVTIKMSDEGGHTTFVTRQFTIDNTPPIVVLQRPSSKFSDKTIDSYGQTFTLEGQAADDNNVSLIRVNIFDDPECTNLVHYVDLTNVPPTISLDVAKFVEGTENDYSKIYGSTSKNGEKNLYCTIAAYDGSQRYPIDGSNQTPDDTRGNVAYTYYLYEEIAATVLSNHKITEIYHMMNGNYLLSNPNRSAETVSSIASSLSASVVSAGRFSLNPENNPTFSISGRDPLTKTNGKFDFTANENVSNGGNVVLEVAVGLDAIPLIADSLKVYVQHYNLETGDVDGEPVFPDTGAPTKSGTSYKFVVPLTTQAGFLIGQNYLFGVQGTDQKGNPVVPNGKGFGFHFASSGAAPTLTVSSPANTISYLRKGSTALFEGDVYSEEGGSTVSLIKDDVVVWSQTFNQSQGHFRYEIPAGTGGFNQQTSAQYAYTVSASQNGLATTVNRTVLYDVDGPEINIDSMLPTASKYKDDESGDTEPGEYLNGDVTLKLSIVDEYDTVDTTNNKPYFTIVNAAGTVIPCRVDSDSVPVENHYITTPAKQNFVIHTTDIPDQTINIRIYAWDRAGNSYYDGVNGTTYLSKEYIVDQTTDKPVILPNNKDSLSLKKTEILTGENSFQTGGQIVLKLIDDDGIKKVVVKCGDETTEDSALPIINGKDKDESGNPIPRNGEVYSSYQNEVLYFVTPPTDAKKYKMQVEVTDKNDVTTTSAVFKIRITAGFPTIKNVTSTPDYVTTEADTSKITATAIKTFENTIITTGSEYPFYIFRKESDFVSGDIPSSKPAVDANGDFTSAPVLGAGVTFLDKNDGNYKDRITPAAGDSTKIYYYKLMDKNWNPSGVGSVECKIDSTAPTGTVNKTGYVPVKKYTDGNSKDWYDSSSIKFSIAVTDAAIDTVAATTSDTWNNPNSVDYQQFSKSGDYYQGSIVLSKGENTVHFRLIDKAGNINYVEEKVYVDVDAPTLTVTDSTVLDYMPGSGFAIKGKAEDAIPTSGALTLTVKEEFKAKNTASYTQTAESGNPAKTTIAIAGDGKWSLHVPLAGTASAEGDYKYTFTLTDPVGNLAISKSYITTVDTTAPVLGLPVAKTGNSAIDETTYKFEGTITEDHLSGIYYKIGSETDTASLPVLGTDGNYVQETTWTNAGWSVATATTTKWNFYQSFKSNAPADAAASGLGEGKYKLFVCAVDGAENRSSIQEVRFDVDMNNPVLTETHSGTININTDNAAAGLKLSGLVSDTNRLDSFEIKLGAESYKIKLDSTDGNYYSYEPDEITKKASADITYDKTTKAWEKSFTTGAGMNLVDGNYDFTMTATDMVGKTSAVTRKVVVDTSAPTINTNYLVIPDSKQTENALFKFEGKKDASGKIASDASPSSGFADVDILFTTSSTVPDASAAPMLSVTPDSTEGTWSSTIEFADAKFSSIFNTQGIKYIWINVSDSAGNKSGWVGKSFNYDTEAPAVTETEVGQDGTYANTTFTLKGLATDTNGVSSVKISAENNNSSGTTSYTYTADLVNDPTEGNKKVTWSKEIVLAPEHTGSIADGSYTFTITVTDVSGKEEKTVRKIVVDTTSPNAPSGTITTSKKTIGGEDWYNTKILSIEVTSSDNKPAGVETNSGIASVSYSTVAYDAADPAKERNWSDLTYASGKYSGNVQLPADGKNQKIYLRVKDIAGNVIGEKDNTHFISCNVDSTAPDTVSVTKVDGEADVTSKLVNGRNDLVLNVTAQDAGTDNTGIKSVDVSGIGINAVNAVGSPKKADGTAAASSAETSYWEITIPKAKLGSGNINLKIQDNAENINLYTSDVQLSFDNKAPESRKITLPDDADSSTSDVDVNKTFEISGTTSDNQAISSVDICYYIDALPATAGDFTGKTWIHYKSIDSDSLTSWTTGNIESTNAAGTGIFQKVPDGTSIYFVPVIIDKAGNCNLDTKSGEVVVEHHQAAGTGFVPKSDWLPANITGTNIAKVIINQDSDRPIITVSNLSCANTDGQMSSTNRVWHKTSELHGTVSDDDGNVKEVCISVDNGTTWTNNLYSNGMWTYPITAALNGVQDIMFKVVDNADTTFTSTTTAGLAAPKLKDTESTPNRFGYKDSANKASVLYARLDTIQPQIKNVYYRTTAPGTITASVLSDPASNGWIAISDISQHWIGGPSSKLYVMFTSEDANGIKETTQKIGSIEGTRVYPSGASVFDITTSSITQVIEFNTSTVNSGSLAKLSLTAKDYSDTVYERSPDTLKVDNDAPLISISTHGDASTVYGSLGVVITGQTRDDNGVNELWFAVTKDKDSVPAKANFTKYTNPSPFAWSLKFDGDINNNADVTANHLNFLNAYLDNLYPGMPSAGDDTKDVYLWLFAVDGDAQNFGTSGYSSSLTDWSAENNTARQCINLKVIPQADKPTVTIDYPGEGSTVGGTIRLSGTTNIMTDSVKAVWIQIDPEYNGTSFNASWAGDLSALISGKAPGYSIVTEGGAAVPATDLTPGSVIKAGIKASGTVQSWNLIINQDSEFRKTDADGETTRTIAVRAYAVSNENHKISNYDETYFTIDPNAPKFNPDLTLEKKGDTSVSIPYTSGAWINGEWYIVGNVQHGAGIKTLKYGDTYLVRDCADVSDANTILTKRVGDTYNDAGHTGWNWDFKIPVGNAISGDYGENKFTLEAVDNGQNKTASMDILVKYDNKAPSGFVPRLNTIPLANTNNKFQQSNGSMTLSGVIDESGRESGLERIAFYFTRDITEGGTTTRYFIDPLVTKEKAGETVTPAKFRNNYVAIGTVAANVFTIDSTKFAQEDGIIWRKSTGSVSNNTVTVASIPENVRIGGLCKVNKVVYRINDISGNVITLNSQLNTVAGVDVYFALGQVIDNTVIETGTTNLYDSSVSDTMSNGDGDQMVEGISQSGTTYTWQASVNSKNMYDGPVTLNFTYFDKAGNTGTASYTGMVSNNAPRLAGVKVGTDYDGDGTLSDEEGEYSFTNAVPRTIGGASVQKSSLVTENLIVSSNNKTNGYAFMTIKDAVMFMPEIIGGNGNLYYSYEIARKDKATAEITGKSAGSFAVGRDDNDEYTDEDSEMRIYVKTHTGETGYVEPKIVVDLTTLQSLDGSEKANPTWFNYRIWDSTDGTVVGTESVASWTSQYASMQVALAVNVHDQTEPKVVVEPFFWESADNNSLYKNDYMNGHIWLEKDIPDSYSATSGAQDKDPKVSGIISVRGTAFDDHKLASLWVKYDDFAPSSGSVDSDGYYKVATYDAGTGWTSLATSSNVNNGIWNFTVTPVYNDKRGHKVKWQLDIDTSNITGRMGTDKKVYIRAIDAAAEAHTSKEEFRGTIIDGDEVYNYPSYRMDVVPYISGIKDSSRSRLGRYTARAGSTNSVVITGFNFNEAATPTVYRSLSNADGTANEVETGTTRALTVTSVTPTTITVQAPEYSGYLRAVWGTISTPNNSNQNDVGYNIQKGYVSSDADTLGFAKANENGSEFWTDDVYLSVWKVAESSLFNGSINPHSGVIKKLDQYNSGSGAPSNVDGSIAAAGPGGGYIYKQPGQNSEVTPVTGMNDSYYAAISSDDLKLYGYVSGRTYTNHGDNIAFNSSEVAYVAPVDEMDYTIVNGTPYYVMQDNGLGGDSGSVWGLGLHLVREGIWYDRAYFNPYKGNTIEEAKVPYIIEKQGSNVASHARNSSTGYDSVLYQFKNPRIAGWYNANDSLVYTIQGGRKSVKGVDYIYVSYYDSYAKCLKYAGFRSGHRFITNDSKLANSVLKDWGKNDIDHDIDIVAEMTTSPMTAGSNQTAQKTYNHLTDGAAVVAGNETTSNNPTYTEIAGEWSDIFVDTTGTEPRPVIIYYSKTAKSLEVAYGNNSFPQQTSEWTKTTGIKPAGVTADFGRYVSAAMDINGNLHVAAQDADNAKLYYLYLKKSGSGYSVNKSVAVDASNGAGRWTDIELTNPEGATLTAIKPVISYIDTGFLGTTKGIKAAYLEKVTDTGDLVFEAMTDPAYYIAGDQRTSVMATVKETKAGTVKAPVAVGFNSDMLALDFLRDEQ